MPSSTRALRALARRPRTSILTVAILALGIGLVAAMASVLRGVWLRGLPFEDGDRIVFFSTGPSAAYPTTVDDFLDLRDSRFLEEVGGFRTFNVVVTNDRGASRATTGTYVTPNLLSMIGASPVLGRGFVPADGYPNAPSVVLLSHSLWERQFGGDAQVLGRTVIVNREAMTIVGVMPRGFHFPVRQEIWPVERFQGNPWSRSGVFAVGRLAPGVSPRLAAEELRRRVERLDADRPLPQTRQAHLLPYVDAVLDSGVRRSLEVMMIAVVAVLLAACLNTANLRFADALSRRGELQVRRALGAGRRQLVALLFGETLVLSTLGVLGGLGIAWALVAVAGRRLVAGGPLRASFWIDLRLDHQVLAIAAAAGIVATLVGGLAPALGAAIARPPAPARRTHSVPSSALAKTLLAGQVAAAFVLSFAALLFTRSATGLLRSDLGFDPDRLASAIVMTYQAEHEDAETRRSFVERLLASLEARPELAGATVASHWPWKGERGPPLVTVDLDRGDGEADAADEMLQRSRQLLVWPGFFATMRLPLVEGRPFDRRDLESAAPPVIVSASLARRLFVESPLGRRIVLGGLQPVRAEIVGVVADLGVDWDGTPAGNDMIYRPFPVAHDSGLFLLVRGRGAPPATFRAIDQALAEIDPRVAALDHETFVEATAVATWVERRLAQIFALFAAATLVLTGAGLYAVLAVLVRGRTRELAIRVAVGALPRDLRALVLGDGARTVVAGIAIGALVIVLAAPAVEPFLAHVGMWDPLAAAVAIGVIGAVSLIASLAPARAAARTDPATVLHNE